MKEKKHYSFSELYLYDSCQYKHYIEYIHFDKRPDDKSIYNVFGSAVHDAIDDVLHCKADIDTAWISVGKKIAKFGKKNTKFVYIKQGIKYEQDIDYKEFVKQALMIYRSFFDYLDKNFSDYKFINSELRLYEKIEGTNMFFKGFVDLILYDPKTDMYHIFDYKTTKWGWDKKKNSDTKLKYQTTLYKKFFCQKYEIPLEKVKTHYLFMKRLPSKTKPEVIVIQTESSGLKKIDNATEWLKKQVRLAQKGMRFKNRSNCTFCPWYMTNLCK